MNNIQPGMMPGPAAGQLAWQQSQSPTTAAGLGNSTYYLQSQNNELNSLTALNNQMTSASGLWSRLQTMASFNSSINQLSTSFARTVSASLLGDANQAIQQMGKF